MSFVEWLQGPAAAQRCPACGRHGEMLARLRLDDCHMGRSSLTLVTCQHCSASSFPDLVPMDYSDLGETFVSVCCERATGLEGAVAALAAIDAGRAHEFLDVGCGLGWALDFAERALGWHAMGVDASDLSEVGRRELGVDIVPGLLGPLSTRGRRFDVIYAGELLEHLVEPISFLTTIRGLLNDGGIFLASTPNAAALTRDAPWNVLRPILSPGDHAVLYDRPSIERLLREAGFRMVQSSVEGAALRVAASDSELHWTPATGIDERVFRRYLDDRAASLPSASAVGIGLLSTLFQRLLRSGERDAADAVYTRLRAAIRERHGIDPEQPEGLLGMRLTADLRAQEGAGVLADTLLARGRSTLLRASERACAETFFLAAGHAARALRDALSPRFDLGARGLILEAAAHAAACCSEPESALAQLELLLQEPDSCPGDRLAVFSKLVGLGAFPAADRLVDTTDETLALLGPFEVGETGVEAAYALAMLRLHHRQDFAGAAAGFATVHQWLTDRLEAGDNGVVNRLWDAAFHHGYSLYRAGDRDPARAVLQTFLTLPPSVSPALAAGLQQHAGAILAELDRAGATD